MKQIRFEGNDKDYPVSQVIKVLSELVQPERLEKIKSVVDKRNKYLVPVMENIYDRGNTSAVMRSAEAFGFYNFHQIIEIDTFKESKRVTQGADKWLLQTEWQSTTNCVEHLRESGHQIVVTHLEGGIPIDEVDFSTPTALFFGSEKEGASSTLTEMADKKVFIPMRGFVQSFNISVAAALCFQQVHYQHKKLGLPPLSDDERQYLLAQYLYKSCKSPPLHLIN